MEWLSRHARPTWMLRSGFLVMILIAIGAVVSTFAAERRHLASQQTQEHQHVIDRLQLAVLQMESGQRGYIITAEEAYLVQYEEGRRAIVGTLDEYRRIDLAAIGLRPPAVPVERLVADKMAELEQTMLMRRDNGFTAVNDLLESDAGLRMMATLREQLRELRRQLAMVVVEQQKNLHFEAYLTVGLVIAGLLLSGGLAATSVGLLRRQIAARQVIESELRQRQDELARSNGELEQFAHIASHDLQEPLRMISSYTQLLRRRYADKLDADANEFIGYAVDGTKRMQALINGLLNFSRIASGAKPLEAVDFEAALDDTLKDLEIRIEDSGATVTREPLPKVLADPVQIRQLLLNLVGNGMKFQPAARKPEVHVSAVRAGAEWSFAVRDNGIGIDAAYFKNLFQIFKRLHTSDEYPGTGIGLAVCKKIVERHGGRIWIESILGEGSTFRFTLPVMEGNT